MIDSCLLVLLLPNDQRGSAQPPRVALRCEKNRARPQHAGGARPWCFLFFSYNVRTQSFGFQPCGLLFQSKAAVLFQSFVSWKKSDTVCLFQQCSIDSQSYMHDFSTVHTVCKSVCEGFC